MKRDIGNSEPPWHFMVPKAGFEPARVSPTAPQAALLLIMRYNPFVYRVVTTVPA